MNDLKFLYATKVMTTEIEYAPGTKEYYSYLSVLLKTIEHFLEQNEKQWCETPKPGMPSLEFRKALILNLHNIAYALEVPQKQLAEIGYLKKTYTYYALAARLMSGTEFTISDQYSNN